MVRSSSGFRSGTRRKLKKVFRAKFKSSTFMREFKTGENVLISQDPASQKGMPHPRFKALAGKVVGKRGSAYIVDVKSGRSVKQLIVNVEHIRPSGK